MRIFESLTWSILFTVRKEENSLENKVLNLIRQNILVQKKVLCFHVRKTILTQLGLWVVAAIHERSDAFTNICGLQIPVADGDRGYGGFATLDVQSVNLIKYPKFKQVRWQYANMTPGDCLFLPYSKHYLLAIWWNQSKKFLSFYWFFLKPLVLHPALLLLTYYVLSCNANSIKKQIIKKIDWNFSLYR